MKVEQQRQQQQQQQQQQQRVQDERQKQEQLRVQQDRQKQDQLKAEQQRQQQQQQRVQDERQKQDQLRVQQDRQKQDQLKVEQQRQQQQQQRTQDERQKLDQQKAEQQKQDQLRAQQDRSNQDRNRAGNQPGGSPFKGLAIQQQTAPPQKIDEIRLQRQQVQVQQGAQRNNFVAFKEPGNRTIIKQDNRVFIRADEQQRFQRFSTSARPFRKPDGTTETVFIRSDGTRVISVADSSGRIVRRVRRLPGGREVVLFDDRPFYRRGGNALLIGAGIGIGVGALLALSRPTVSIARERYIVDYGRASDDEIYEAFSAPPISRLERRYTLDEIRYNPPLREHMRRVDLDEITFETGSSTVSPDQYGKLERLARIITRVLDRDPAEVFMIEGHTDAPGDEQDNLSLSDRRAEAIADILSSEFGVPPENLVTQGYGEQELKINTRDAERQNRRVTMRRIGPLLNREANN